MSTILLSVYRYLVFKRPLMLLIGLLLITVIAALGLPRFKLDASADSLTLESDNSIDYFRQINQRYQSGDFLVVTYTPKAEMFSDEAINTLKQLRDDLENVSGIVGVNSILDVPLLYSPIRTLAQQRESTRTLLTPGVDRVQAKQEFLTSPIYRDMLLSDDGKTTALQLNLAVNNIYIEMVRTRDALRMQKKNGLTSAEAQELDKVEAEFLAYRTKSTAADHARVEQVRQVLKAYESKAQVFLGGMSMITADMIAFIKSDLVVFGAALLFFIILMMTFIFRQWRFVVLPLLVCVMSVVIVLGWLSWVDWRLTVISSNFVALLLIMSLAITIHLVVRYRELHASHADWSQEQLVFATVSQMVRPCVYTALTTIVAFVSLVVSDIRPVIDFGWMMTIGLVVALLLAFLLLPAALILLPKGEPKDKGDNSGAITMLFSKFVERHGNIVVSVAVAAALVSIYGMSLLVVENRFIDYFHKDTEIYQGMSVIDKNLGGTVSLEIILDAKAPESTVITAVNTTVEVVEDEFGLVAEDPFAENEGFDDEFGDDGFGEDFGSDTSQSAAPSVWFNSVGLSRITQLHNYLEALPEVGKVQSLATMYQVAEDINGGKLNNFELDVMRNMLSKDISGFLIAPYLKDIENQARITLRIQETSPELKRAELVEKIKNFAINEVHLAPEQVHFTGMLVLYNNMLQSLFRSQIVTMGAVFFGIMIMFIILFRSFTIAIISLLPNILAASVVLGGMGLTGVPLDMMTITIAAITVGVGVDHAIHYLYRLRTEFSECGSYITAMHRSHASIGRAMYYTAVIIIVGFSILALSEFIPSIYFGLLTALAMFAAILGSLTLLPKLVLMTKPFGPEPV